MADGKTIRDKIRRGEVDDYANLYQYEIRSDAIVNKKKLLKSFCRGMKNLIAAYVYDENFYTINYTFWKDNLKNIITYCEDEK